MSAPFLLNLKNLADLGLFLADLSEATRKYGVRIDAYGRVPVSVADVAINVRWDDAEGEYVIDDRIGD